MLWKCEIYVNLLSQAIRKGFWIFSRLALIIDGNPIWGDQKLKSNEMSNCYAKIVGDYFGTI